MKVRSLLLALLFLLPSFLFLSRASFSYFPAGNSRVISIEIELKGSYQEGVEQIITNPLEEELSRLEGLKDITSVSEDEKSRLTLSFHNQVDLDRAYLAVSDTLDRVSTSFPSHAGKPRLFRSDSRSFPVFILMIRKEEIPFSRNSLENWILSLPGVGKVEIGGMENKDLILKATGEHLLHYGLDTGDILSVIGENNRLVSIPVRPGLSLTGDLRYRSPEDFAEQRLRSGLTLENLATPYWRDAPRKSIARVNGEETILVWVHLSGDGNAVRLCRRLTSLQKTIPGSRILYNRGAVVEKALWKTARAGITGIAAVFLVTGLFLKKIKTAVLISLNIPFSLVVSLAVLTLAGKEIDLMVLSGCCVATGLIIDGGVILAECGSKEALKPVFYSLVSTVLVFLVFLFAPVQVKELYQGMILSITLVMGISFLYLFGILGHHLIHTEPVPHPPESYLLYDRIMDCLSSYRWISLALLMCLSGLCGYGAFSLSFRSEVSPDDGNLSFSYEYPSGIPKESILEDLKGLEEKMTLWEEIDFFSSSFKPEKAIYQVELSDRKGKTRDLLKEKIIRNSRGTGGSLFFENNRKTGTYEISVLAHDRAVLFSQARNVADYLQASLKGVRVILHFKKRPPLLRLESDRKVMAAGGVTPMSLYGQVSRILNIPVRLKWLPGEPVFSGQYTYDVRFLNGSDSVTTLKELQELPVRTGPSDACKLDDLVMQELVPDFGRISHYQGRRGVQLSLEFEDFRVADISRKVEDLLNRLSLPDGVTVIHGKTFREKAADLRSLFLCVLLAITLIFLLLLFVFESLPIPLYLIIQIPGSLLFPLGLLALFRIPVTSPVLFSLILIIGISVNNGIVLFGGWSGDVINRDFLVNAVHTRSVSLLAALMTTVAGIIPLLLTREGLNDPFGALSFTIGSGLIHSLVSLYLTLALLDFRKGKKKPVSLDVEPYGPEIAIPLKRK